MTLRLVLIRHAKAAPGIPGGTDRDRPLAKRGRRDAPRMGRWIADGGFAPEDVLCSDARRTRETLELMLFAWPAPPRVRHVAALYAATPEAMRAALAGAEGATVALVGHNPGVTDLAHALAREAPGHPRWDDVPTAAVAVLGFEADRWDAIADGTGEVLAFATPGDLDP